MRHKLNKIKAIRLLTDSENLIHILVSHLEDDSVPPDDLYIPSSAEGHIEEYLSENYKGIMFLRKLSKPSYRNRVIYLYACYGIVSYGQDKTKEHAKSQNAK